MAVQGAPGCPVVGIDPEIAVAAVAIIGALAHATVAIMRGMQDLRRASQDTRRAPQVLTHEE